MEDGSFVHPPIRLKESIAEVHEHSQEFTGLLDKNGKEIYEGDVMKGSYTDDDGKTQGVTTTIEFRYGRFEAVWGRGSHLCISDLHETNREIIGNIYENPELLKN